MVAVLGLYVWFWGSPVGVNNYVNKVSLQMLFRSPELLTSIGAVDNSPLDFHSDKLGDYDKQSELEMLEFIKKTERSYCLNNIIKHKT